jgi:hypothetical protein
MNSFAEANLQEATQAYAVANTPLFLIRRLQEDPVVNEISTSFTGEQILQELRNALARRPESLLDYTRPYVYLVALSKLPSSEYLAAVETVGNEGWRWVSYIKDVLLAIYSPLSTANVLGEVARLAPDYAALTHTDSPTSSSIVIVED